MSTDVAPVASPSPDALWIAPDAQPLADERSARRRSTLRLFAVLLLLTAALRLPAFFVDVFNSDESFLGAQAEVIKDGGKLYQEAADRKPPLVPYLYAATFTVFGALFYGGSVDTVIPARTGRRHVLHIVQVDKLVNHAVRVAGDIAQRCILSRRSIETVNRHNGK